MRLRLWVVGGVLLLFAGQGFGANPQAAEKPKEIFNGKDLTGWDGNPKLWSVEDGAIVGQTTADAPLQKNTFLIWRGDELRDFLLHLQYQVHNVNSGVQYRSHVVDPARWIVGGYQADIDSGKEHTGILYEELGRGILTNRGEKVKIAADGKRTAEKFADAAELQKSVHENDWNDYVIEARGPRLRQWINGKLMSETVDEERGKSAEKGVLALQLHVGGPMTVKYRKLDLETLNAGSPDYEPKPADGKE
jgi:3-keto-disaccharide hydrolase